VPLYLPRNLAALATVAARDCGRYSLAAVRVKDPGGGLYRAEATDGKVLAIVQGPAPEACYPALEERPDGDAEVLIPRDDWQKAFRLGDRHRPVGLAAWGGEITLAVGDQALTTRPVDGRYPDVDQILPRHGALLAVRLDPGLLAELLKVATAVNPGGGVDLLFYGRGKPLGLMTRSNGGQTFDALIMPLT
jgi:DNA polymerase III sliding clamp (beta) subunit (PCNA family)